MKKAGVPGTKSLIIVQIGEDIKIPFIFNPLFFQHVAADIGYRSQKTGPLPM